MVLVVGSQIQSILLWFWGRRCSGSSERERERECVRERERERERGRVSSE